MFLKYEHGKWVCCEIPTKNCMKNYWYFQKVRCWINVWAPHFWANAVVSEKSTDKSCYDASPVISTSPWYPRYRETAFSQYKVVIRVGKGCLNISNSGLAIRCYSDHAGPNSAGGIETCDEGGVCSSSRIIFRSTPIHRCHESYDLMLPNYDFFFNF